MNVVVSSRHGILRLHDDHDVGIHFVRFHPTVAAERNRKKTKRLPGGLAVVWSNFIIQPGRKQKAWRRSLFRYRRWQTRLKAPLRRATSQLRVVVTHRFPAPNRYGWELRPPTGLSVEESRVQFASWEEANQAGKLALKQFSGES